MNFSEIFDVFSRRKRSEKVLLPVVSVALRYKILMLCRDIFNGEHKYQYIISELSYTRDKFWHEIHRALTYRHGIPRLSNVTSARTEDADVVNFLGDCKDEDFLDFIELIFKTSAIAQVCPDENLLVDDINSLLVTENVGYELTNIVVKESSPGNTKVYFAEQISGHHPNHNVIAFPQVILKENLIVHTEILKPVLSLLTDVKYANANREFLEALEHYRKADYGNCLTLCSSAFESVMKILCAQKNWGCSAQDSASKLIDVMVNKLPLEPYLVPFLTTVTTLRNRLSKSHGAGVQTKDVPQYIARYALNVNASAITLLVDASK